MSSTLRPVPVQRSAALTFCARLVTGERLSEKSVHERTPLKGVPAAELMDACRQGRPAVSSAARTRGELVLERARRGWTVCAWYLAPGRPRIAAR